MQREMKKTHYLHLSKRESQIMDIVHQLGEAGVADVLKHLPDSPSYDAVRVTMTILEKKGYLKHKQESHRYIYLPTEQPENAKLSALDHILATFFKGSAQEIVSAILKLPSAKLSKKELDELSQMIENAKKSM